MVAVVNNSGGEGVALATSSSFLHLWSVRQPKTKKEEATVGVRFELFDRKEERGRKGVGFSGDKS